MAAPEWLEQDNGSAVPGPARATRSQQPRRPGQTTPDQTTPGQRTPGQTTPGEGVPFAAAEAKSGAPLAAPEPASGTPGVRQGFAGAAVSSGQGCSVLVSTAGLLLEQCAGAFDPVVLAQLDAALAHELAAGACRRAEDAAARLGQQIRAGAPAGNLADLAHYVSAARGTATKAQSQAAAATDVVLALGGTTGAGPTDPAPVPGAGKPAGRGLAASGGTRRATGAGPTAGPSAIPDRTANATANATANETVNGTANDTANGAVNGAVNGEAAARGPAGFDGAVVAAVDPSALVDVIARLEEVKNAAAAAQAQAEALFMAQQRLAQARAGVVREKLGKGVAEQVALARHESAARGRQLCGLAQVVVREMPHAMAAFSAGILSEYGAGILARETACLTLEHRAAVDALVCADQGLLATMGNRELGAAAKKAGLALDPAAVAKRYARAESERYVSLRPAADGMTLLTALLPLRQGVRALHLLTRIADAAKAAGDERGTGQLMADTLLHRLTRHDPCTTDTPETDNIPEPGSTAGTAGTAGGAGAGVPGNRLCTTVSEPDVALELVMTDRALFDGASDPALLVGHEPIPAPAARALVYGTPDGGPPAAPPGGPPAGQPGGQPGGQVPGQVPGQPPGAGPAYSPRVWLKRLFTHPESNALLAMDSKGRLFPEGMKEFLRLRDQTCATPYCDAPIREYDHIKAWAAGGETSIANGQGLCTACNQAKEAPGWTTTTNQTNTTSETSTTGETSQTTVTTPTGHSYVSTAPPLPGPTRRQRTRQR